MIPAKLRSELGDDCKVTLGRNENIYIFSEEGYDRFLEEHVLNRPFEDENAQILKEFFTSNAEKCAVDKQGRVTLPRNFLEYADIEKETVTVGNGEYIAVWSKAKYDAKRNPKAIDVNALFGAMLKYVDK
jgi:MraZ protein